MSKEIAKKPKRSMAKDISTEHRHIIAEKMGQYWRDNEIIKHFRETFGMEIQPSYLSYFKESKTWKPVIQSVRERFNESLGEVDISSKRVRLEALSRQYHKADEKGQIISAIKALERAQIEIEGKHGQGNNYFFTQIKSEFNNYSDEELDELTRQKATRLQEIRMIKQEESEDSNSDET